MRIIVARPCAAQSLGAILAVLALVLLPAIDAAGANPRTGFSVYSLAGTPPAPVGTSCPGQASDCTNYAAEPAIRAAADGTFYASSENGLGGGTLAWKSTDGGLHYASLLSPNNLSATTPAVSVTRAWSVLNLGSLRTAAMSGSSVARPASMPCSRARRMRSSA